MGQVIVRSSLGVVRDRFDSVEVVEYTLRWFRAIIEEEEDWSSHRIEDVERKAELECRDDCSLLVGVVAHELRQGVEQLFSLARGVCASAAPDLAIDASGMGLEFHLCDNRELVPATTQRPPQVWVLRCRSSDDSAIVKHCFKLVNVVTCKPLHQLAEDLSGVENVRSTNILCGVIR